MGTVVKPATILPYLILILCMDLSLAGYPQIHDNNESKNQSYLKEEAKKHPLPYYFISTYNGLSNELMSSTEVTQTTPIPTVRLYKNFGKLVAIHSTNQATSPKVKQQMDAISKLWEADQVDLQPTGKYLPSILLPYASHDDFLEMVTKSPDRLQSDPTAKDNKLTAKLMELSKHGKFNEVLILSIQAFEIYFSLAPIYQADQARFFDVLEANAGFKMLDEHSQKILVQAFGNLPTQQEIQTRNDTSSNDFLAEYVSPKWAILSTMDYVDVRNNLSAEFSKKEQVSARQYENMLLKKNAEEAARQQVFSSYIKKAEIHQNIIRQRLQQAKLTTKVAGQRLDSSFIETTLRIYKFEVQFTPVVDGFEYMKPGLNRVLQILVQHQVINHTEKDALQSKFRLNISHHFTNKTDQLKTSTLKQEINAKFAKDLTDSLTKRMESTLNGDKAHLEIYQDRLAYQMDIGNFAKFTPHETKLRELLQQEIQRQEDQFVAEMEQSHEHEAMQADFVIPSGRRQANETSNSAWAFVMRESVGTNGSNMVKKLKSGSYLDDDIVEINSQRVVELYKHYTPAQKQLFMEIVSANINKLAGTSIDMEKVHALIDYENLHDHNNRLKFAVDLSGPKDILTAMVPADGRLLTLEAETHVSLSQLARKYSKRKRERRGKLSKALKYTKKSLKLASTVVEEFEMGDEIQTYVDSALEVTENVHSVYKNARAVTKAFFGAKDAVKTAVKATGAFKGFLSKVAGPVGDIADIALSSYSLSTAIERLNDPNADKFDQSDAIADIVESSVSIGMSAASIAVSIAFPPAAPIMALVSFFVNLFTGYAVRWTKADTHIKRLESSIPLLDFEKTREWNRNFNGKETSYYIQGLINAIGQNNDLVVQSIKLLEARPEFLGTIKPAVSIAISSRRECRQVPRRYVGSLWIVIPDSSADEQVCNDVTERDPVVNPNSVVDLRQEGYYYRDRSSPQVDKIEEPAMKNYEIFCFPNSKTDQSYKISERTLRYGYLCHHAIGVQRRVRNSGENLMYIDLEDGDDTVYSNDNSDIFIVYGGVKNFYGGAGNDIFRVVDCMNLGGVLDGESGTNTLQFEQTCASSSFRRLSLERSGNHHHHLKVEGSGRHGAQISNMENLIGRASLADWVHGAQSFESINLMGGAEGSWDLIFIDGAPIVADRSMRIILQDYTQVRVSSYGTGVIQMIVPRRFASAGRLVLQPHQTLPKIYFLVQFDDLEAIDFKTYNSTTPDYNIKLVFGAVRTFEFRLIGTESEELNSKFKCELQGGHYGKHLRLNTKDETVDVAHYLDSTSNAQQIAKGTTNAHNYFNLYQGAWNVNGSGDDTFIVHLGAGNLNGICNTPESEGSHELQVSSTRITLNTTVSFNFETGSFVAPAARLVLKGITTFNGLSLVAKSVVCNCHASQVHTRGGSSKKANYIYYNSTCQNQDALMILAMGYTHIDIGPMSLGNRDVVIRIKNSPAGTSHITISRTISHQVSEGRLEIFIPVRTSGVLDTTLDIFNSQISLKLYLNPMDSVQFTLKIGDMSEASEEFEYLDVNTDIFFLPKGPGKTFTAVRRDNLQVEIIHELLRSDRTSDLIKRESVPKLTNVFYCKSGDWSVIGSEMDDRFLIESAEFTGSLDGRGGHDTLILESSITGHIEANLGENGSVSFYSQKQAIKVQRIGTLRGRPRLPETVITGRDTLLISKATQKHNEHN